MPLTIQNIDEQVINVGTEDYDLSIAIGGSPDAVLPTGLFEGFYHDWDAANGTLHIKSVEVERLVSGGIWTITAQKSGEPDVSREIIYNVVPTAPIITPPGNQAIYKGAPVNLHIPVANNPAIMRGTGLLAGLKWEPSSDEDGNTTIQTTGVVPVDAVFTESSFDATYYAENDGGSDEVTVRFTISDGFVLVFHRTSRRLTAMSGSGTRLAHYTAPAGTYLNAVSGADGIYLYNTTNRTLYKVNAELNQEWTYQIASGATIAQMLYYDGGIFLLDSGNNELLKVNASDGSLAWAFSTGGNDRQLAIGDGFAYVFHGPNNTSRLQKINTDTGTRALTYSHDQVSFLGDAGAPVYQNRFVYAYNSYGFDPLGRRILKFDVEDLTLVTSVTPRIGDFGSLPNGFRWAVDSDGHIYVENSNFSRLFRHNGTTGARDWTIQMSGADRNWAVLGDSVYWHGGGNTYKHNRTTGAQERTLSGYTSGLGTMRLNRALYSDGAIYATCQNGFVKITDSTFRQAWGRVINATTMPTGLSPVLDAANVMAVRDTTNDALIAVNRSTGAVSWTYLLPDGSASTLDNTYSQIFFFGNT